MTTDSGDTRTEEQHDAAIRALEQAMAESRAMHDQLFIMMKGLQKTVDDGIAHLEKWCERLQDTVEHHLAVCAETASLMLSETHRKNSAG